MTEQQGDILISHNDNFVSLLNALGIISSLIFQALIGIIFLLLVCIFFLALQRNRG
jgi:hypothetical protein